MVSTRSHSSAVPTAGGVPRRRTLAIAAVVAFATALKFSAATNASGELVVNAWWIVSLTAAVAVGATTRRFRSVGLALLAIPFVYFAPRAGMPNADGEALRTYMILFMPVLIAALGLAIAAGLLLNRRLPARRHHEPRSPR